jgi:hypothetical protein
MYIATDEKKQVIRNQIDGIRSWWRNKLYASLLKGL